ncbi:cytochrome C [Oceanicola sp. 22II-s10i]|uniref:c-type cytochrome biogenesis protein CcmI n=1 Tax=Oceanicola sp. 22II-s10i TaxID=1317116 RepID=UPI000B527622|nr:c-type cytochrome biogenesis protein CcmI [Oceanicola sp. 22II-s10i]OWU84563.1 cytochrome C [Oceanicola sp. 22II-s10i]
MLFWIIAAALTLGVAAVMGLTALRAHGLPAAGGADVPVYRAQLAEVDRDMARGTIGAEEGARLKNEIARRLLAADAAAKGAVQASRRAGPLALAGVGVVLAAVTFGVYLQMGVPGYGDLPLADRLERAKEFKENRPSQAAAEADVPPMPAPEVSQDFLDLMEKLRAAVAGRPDDLQGHRLLARNEAALGRFTAAYAAQERVLSILGNGAGAQDYLDYGEYLILAAGGYVSPQAEQALRAAVARDETLGGAQYYLGVMWRQTGRPDVAFRIWDRLLRKGPEDEPWIAPIRAQIDEAAMLAGVDYEQPAPVEQLAGPSADDVAAARDMSAEDRQEMIRGMVSRLSERLAAQGGTAEEWARLIGAYGVLGNTGQARAIYDEALQVFAGREDDLAMIREAAVRAGLSE